MIEGKWKIDRSYKNICIEMMTENLASLRAKADITQGEISNLIGISRQTYYAIETGQRTMSWNTYLSLLLFFDTNNSTRSMLRALSIYPKELMSKMCGICVTTVILADDILKVFVLHNDIRQPARALPNQVEEAADIAGLTTE